MKCDLTGKVSLVTGSARGIGQAIADRLATNGSRVVYSDLDPADAAQAAARFPGALGVRLDVTRPEEIAGVIERVVGELGRLDILVNNAGVNTLAHRVTIDAFPRDEWDRILAVDLTGGHSGDARPSGDHPTLVGRDDELAFALAQWRKVVRDRRSAMVLLCGEVWLTRRMVLSRL